MLPINFHKTFVPERRLIGALLHYAALGKQGTYQEISAETGIPMGRSTGKVPAVLDYARGMGLVELAGEARRASKRPTLTPLGRVVYEQDQYLGEALTQWVAHMNLCRADGGALGWRVAFAEGWAILGNRFTRAQLENYLVAEFGAGNSRTGPLLRTYEDDAALGRAGVLRINQDMVERRPAPVNEAYAIAYSAITLALFEAHFPGQAQVTLSDFGAQTLWFDICGWGEGEIEQVCGLMEREGLVAIDRQMRPWILEKRAAPETAWPALFRRLA